jgi:hypothetical protein
MWASIVGTLVHVMLDTERRSLNRASSQNEEAQPFSARHLSN